MRMHERATPVGWARNGVMLGGAILAAALWYSAPVHADQGAAGIVLNCDSHDFGGRHRPRINE